MTEMQEKYVSLLETLFGEVPKWRHAFQSGPLDGVLEARDNLFEALMKVRSLAHDLSNLDNECALVLMLIEGGVTQELLQMTDVSKFAAAAGSAA